MKLLQYILLLAVLFQGMAKVFPGTHESEVLSDPAPASVSALFTVDVTSGCSPLTVTITNHSTGADNFSWDFGDGNTQENEQPTTFTYTWSHAGGNIPQQFTLSLTATANGNSDTKTTLITVFPPVQTSITVSDELLTGCAPHEVAFTQQSENASQFIWNFGDNNTSSSPEPIHIFQNNGDAPVVRKVILTARSTPENGLCLARDSVDITIFPSPTAGFILSGNSLCAIGGQAAFTIHNQAGNASMINYTITNDQNEEIIAFENDQESFEQIAFNNSAVPVVYTITQTAGNEWGCDRTFSRNFTLYPEIIPVMATVESGCHPLDVSFAHETPNAVSWFWQFSDGTSSIQENPERTFFNPGHLEPVTHSAQMQVTSAHGCVRDTTIYFEVHPLPKAAFNLPQQQVCTPASLELTNSSQISGNHDFLWSVGEIFDTLAAPGNITLLFENPSEDSVTLPISLTLTNTWGCKHTAEQNITLFPEVVAEFQTDTLAGCHPLEISFTNLSTGANGNQPYLWNYSNGTSGILAPTHTRTFSNTSHENTEAFTITLTAQSQYGCIDSVSRQITVWPLPLADYTLSAVEGCSPLEATITDHSQGNDLTYLWDFGDGSTSTQPGNTEHSWYIAPGNNPENYLMRLEITNDFGCLHSHEQNITVFPDVVAAFSVNTSGCHPLEATFSNESEGASQWNWNLGDGNQSDQEHPSHIFLNPSHTEAAPYEVILTANSEWGCSHIFSDSITVFPLPHIRFSMSNSSGCSPLEVSFENLSMGGDEYTWDFGEEAENDPGNTFQQIFSHDMGQPDSLTITLSSGNSFGCEGQYQQSLVVYPQVTAGFTSENDTTQGCSPLFVQFVNQSVNAGQYQWTFGNGATSAHENPGQLFVAGGIPETHFTTNLLASSTYGCSDSASMEITVFAQPVADFEALPLVQHFPDRTVFINNYSSPGEWDFLWNMGDGSSWETTSRDAFSHEFLWDEGVNTSQDFDITLQVSGEHCSDQMSQQVSVLAGGAIASFDSDVTEGCPPLTVAFTNNSIFTLENVWDFGDGNSSAQASPVHVFQEPGTYEVVLSVSGSGGEDNISRFITVFQPPVANFRVEPPEIVLPVDHAQMINLTALGQTWHWDFGDGNTSEEENPAHYYTQPGTYEITLTAGNNTDPQCFHQVTKEINVFREEQVVSCYMHFPNAFTPNPSGPNGGEYMMGDPANFVFHPKHEGIEEFHIEIFNRWGEKIFESHDVWVGWDGYVRGKLAPMGVYIYKATGRCHTGREMKTKGDVTLVR